MGCVGGKVVGQPESRRQTAEHGLISLVDGGRLRRYRGGIHTYEYIGTVGIRGGLFRGRYISGTGDRNRSLKVNQYPP